MLVEGPREITLHELVIVDGLGNNPAHELEIAQVVAVAVREGVDGIDDTVAWRGDEQSVHRVEDLAGYDDVPLPQQPACVLPVLT
ncbi:hypothetical protein DPMN_017267 [Dreissena polymorpha]|uniref:Uncharacterized protein n=1 Tax=Dreissena polymorpha TaxID=45954 RepID=A0A9D4NEI6_DREPO|nr:hypothetical protein DPMN_017267 [Dreissena polymorpha]